MKTPLTILAVNPGSTSTKLAVSRGDDIVKSETISHASSELVEFRFIWDQFPGRLDLCKAWAKAHVTTCSAVVAIGGLLRSVDGGTYRVNERMLHDAFVNMQGEHASNLGCALADALARDYQCSALVVDPVSVDEFEPLARYSGHPSLQRRSLSHALNIHAAARRAALELGIPFERSSLIVAHLGGGISVAPVRGGKIIDVNDASSDGPFSPERTGGLPLQQFISLCHSGNFTERELRALVMGKGGLVAYLGTNSAAEVEERMKRGDPTAEETYRAMAYQIAKEIGAMASVLHGNVQLIVLTGGLAQSDILTSWIEERIRFIAPVKIYASDDELKSLVEGALRVLRGLELTKEYE